MMTPFRLYRGLKICPLVYPHQYTGAGAGHNYEEGFDAAVRIREAEPSGAQARSRVFSVGAGIPYRFSGDARRASISFA